MSPKTEKKVFEKISDKGIEVLLYIGIINLAMMMFLTAIDVGLRYIFNKPILGASELIEFMMAIFVPFSILFCAKENSHISVELVVERLPRKIQKLLNVITTSLTILFYGLIAWQNVHYVLEDFESKLTSAVLLIPTYPFIIPVAVTAGLLCLVLFSQLLSSFPEDE